MPIPTFDPVDKLEEDGADVVVGALLALAVAVVVGVDAKISPPLLSCTGAVDINSSDPASGEMTTGVVGTVFAYVVGVTTDFGVYPGSTVVLPGG